MKTASQANNPQQQQPQAQAPQQQQPVSQVAVPTSAPLDVDTIIQKLTSELTQMSIADVLNSPVLAAAAANPELVGLIKSAFINADGKTAKQEVTVTTVENTKEEITLPTRYGVLAGMFKLA